MSIIMAKFHVRESKQNVGHVYCDEGGMESPVWGNCGKGPSGVLPPPHHFYFCSPPQPSLI